MVISDYLTGSQKLVFLLLLGIGLFGWEVYSAAKSNEASSWPSTTATITQSEIKKVRKSRRRRGRRRSSWSRELHVQYDYYVQGQSYNNNRVAFGNSVSNALDSIGRPNVVDQYPKGKSVTVYYNPDNPKDSVLEPFQRFLCSPQISCSDQLLLQSLKPLRLSEFLGERVCKLLTLSFFSQTRSRTFESALCYWRPRTLAVSFSHGPTSAAGL